MQHRVPECELRVIAVDLAHDLRREDKDQHNILEQCRNVDPEHLLNEHGDEKQNKRERAKEDVLIVPYEELTDPDEYDQRAEDHIDCERGFVLFVFRAELNEKTGLFCCFCLLFFH